LTTRSEPRVGPPLIGALLRMPVDAIRGRMLAGLDEAGFTDLVPAHFAVMRYPGPEGQRPSQLAAQAGMTKQAMNYLLGQLEQLGYLTRNHDPDDHRSKRIRLTDRGHAAARCIRTTVAEIETELEQELGSKRFAQLRRLLTQLNATDTIIAGTARRA
jgi:DNA-binding MarR family transcriptional regulator